MNAPRTWYPFLPSESVTPESIATAKAASDAERRAFTKATGREVDDDGTLGLRLANCISAAVYGPKGENR